jgi:hypothetical protein
MRYLKKGPEKIPGPFLLFSKTTLGSVPNKKQLEPGLRRKSLGYRAGMGLQSRISGEMASIETP